MVNVEEFCAQTLHRCFFAEACFDTIDVFEQQASFGGCWNYINDPQDAIDVPQTDPDKPLEEPTWKSPNGTSNGLPYGKKVATFESPMYERLETNIPHVIMKHSDASSLESNQLFPSREKVREYLITYAEDIRHLVRFQTQVTDIRKSSHSSQDSWRLQFKDLHTSRMTEKYYDAILIANGHYTVPSLPAIKGIAAWNTAYPNTITHSKNYRRPAPYTGKKVLVIGNSASGVDIASQIATVAKLPILISIRSNSPLAYEAGYKIDVPQISEFLAPEQGKTAVRFVDGRVEKGVEAVLFATGYFFSFPFLSDLKPKIIGTGERVEGLYKHMFYIPDPTLAFIGLPSKIIPFRTVEGQAAVVVRVWSERLSLPSEAEMRKWEESLITRVGAGKGFHVLNFPEDFDYLNELVEWAKRAESEWKNRGKVPPRWNERELWTRKRFPAIKKAFADRGEGRHAVRTVEELGFDYDEWCKDERRVEEDGGC